MHNDLSSFEDLNQINNKSETMTRIELFQNGFRET